MILGILVIIVLILATLFWFAKSFLYVSIQNKTGSEICLDSVSLGIFEDLQTTRLEVGGHIRILVDTGIAEQLFS